MFQNGYLSCEIPNFMGVILNCKRMNKVDVYKEHSTVDLGFDWQLWKNELKFSNQKNYSNMVDLKIKYSELTSGSLEAIENCNKIAKTKCQAIVSGIKVHMLASLPHEKNAKYYNWENWLKSGIKTLNNKIENVQQNIINEVVITGQNLPVEEQKLYADCMEQFLLKGLDNIFERFNQEMSNQFKHINNIYDGSSLINQWAMKQNEQILSFFY